MKFNSYAQAKRFAALETIRTHQRHDAVRATYWPIDSPSPVQCWTVVIMRVMP